MEPSDDIREADWITTRLADGSYQVRMLLPPVFAAYVRVLHPIVDSGWVGRKLIRWREVAASAGLGPLDRLARSPVPPERTAVTAAGTPLHGELASEDQDRLLPILAEHTSTALRCWFCVWDGYGPPVNPPGGPAVPLPTVRGSLERRYYLYAGQLGEVMQLSLPPSVWWPADHAWCLASDVDLAWTYIGGPAGLADQLLADPFLEVMPADPLDSITDG